MKKTEFSQYEEEVIRLRRHFHQYPELALQEFQTSAFIQKYLEELGYQVRHVPPTGLIAEHPCMKNREKMVVLRAEMDALPVQECTGLAYASRNKGCMHACGHDGILAVALTLAKILSGQKDFPVAVRFLFEPAEEIGEGTVRMLEGGALDKDKGRKADGFLMFHYACDQPLGMAVHKGQASAMIGKMEILIKGKSSHWCQAEKGIDSIYAAGLVVQKVHEISRDYVGKGPHVAGIGTIHGGEYPNIISDQVNNYKKKETDAVAAMTEVKALAYAMKDELLKGNLNSFGKLLDYGWNSKKRMSNKITNPKIDELYEEAIKAGALGGKLLGAGGGGYLLMYCPYNVKHKVAERMEKAGGQLADWNFELRGAQAWTMDSNRWDYQDIKVQIPEGRFDFKL